MTLAGIHGLVASVQLTPEIVEARKQRMREISRKHYLANKEELLRRGKERYYADPAKKMAVDKLWRKKNKGKADGYLKKYRASHRKQCRQRCRDWYKKHHKDPEFLEKKRTYRQKMYPIVGAELRARCRRWHVENRDHPCFRVSSQKRRALKKGAKVTLGKIKDWIASVKAAEVVVCYYCQSLVLWGDVHFDHVIPLSKGGPHSVENLCVSCATCNLKKGDSFINEWRKMGQQMLAL